MEAGTQPQILGHLSALADGLRGRLLLLLEQQELTVSELCSVLQLPQSTVSRHLKTLTDGGWISSRPEGTRRLYHLAPARLDPSAHGLWKLTREQIAETASAAQDEGRLRGVLAERRSRSQQFFGAGAGQWDRLRGELFGGKFLPLALLALLEQRWVVGDLGCGTGLVAEVLAPHIERLIAVDDSQAMLEAAERRLDGLDNVELRRGELEALPIEDGQLDAATLILVLHHLADPAKALAETSRVLRPGGKLLIVDMLPHDRQEYRQEMGHVWMGFSEEQVGRYLSAAGLRPVRFQPLPADSSAKGPTLFALAATRSV